MERVEDSQSATFVATNDRLHAFARRSLQTRLRWHSPCDKTKSFKFAPKGQA
jgi:hypothetical protein